MRWGVASGRIERGARAAATGLACLALALALAGARAEDFTGRADLTYAQDDGTLASSDYLRQVYYLDYRRQFSNALSYRLSLRYQDDRGTTAAAEARSKLRLRSLAPSGSVDCRLEGFAASLSYRRNDEDILDPAVGRFTSRLIERLSGFTSLQVFGGGDVILSADRLAYSSMQVDTTDDRAALSFRYTSDTFRLLNDNRVQRFTDGLSGLSRTSMGPRVSAVYARPLGAGWSMSAQYVVDYFRTEQEIRSVAGGATPVEVQPVTGLFVNDDLPIETPPMTPDPALVDRAFDTSAGISLGPDGASFQNLGLDMGRFVPLDELRVHVRNASGVPVPSGGPVTWSVYASPDGLRWAPVDGTTSVFSTEMSAYLVSFAPTNARYFKVVNFGVNTVETLVTELQAFVHELLQPNQTIVSSALRQGLALTLGGRVGGKVLLAYTGQLNADTLSAYRGGTRWSTDATNAATATVGPFGAFWLGFGQGFTRARQPFGLEQTSFASTASVRYEPIERFSTTLEGRRAEDRLTSVISVRAVTYGTTLSGRLAPLDTLQLSLVGGYSSQDIVGGGTTDYLTATGQALLNLTRDLDLQLDSTVQRTLAHRGDTSAQLEVPLIRIVTYYRYTGEARFHPAPQLALMARVGYSGSDAGQGLLQLYRASWSPFQGGTVQLAFDYSEEIDPLSGRSLRRGSASPRWLLNRNATLELNYNVVRGSAGYPVRQQNLYVTFSLKV